MTVDPRDILIISRIPGVGPNRLRALLTRFGDASTVASAPDRSLRRIEGIEEKTAASITAFFRSGAAEEAARFADDQRARSERAGARAVTLWDPGYPPSLRNIYDPPLSFSFAAHSPRRTPARSRSSAPADRVPTASSWRNDLHWRSRSSDSRS
jgi:NAD-dependent DNA ligase